MDNKYIFPITQWSNFITLFSETIRNLNHAVEIQNYQQIIQHSTAVIEAILQQNTTLTALYETRAYAYAMRYQFDLALADGEQIIKHTPTATSGYIYKANVLSMKGYQKGAIRSYDQGLQVVQKSKAQDQQKVEMEALKIGKQLAIKEHSQKFFDPVDIFPVEITTKIFSLLTQEALLTCLLTSKTWCDRVQDCAEAWRSLVIQDERMDFHLARVTSKIGDHVKHMKIGITTFEMGLFKKYLKHLIEGHFTRIQSLEIQGKYKVISMSKGNIKKRL
ncbi:hypothetical protein BDA99DRAFT_42778 [Phascolomyces articulosus]|uniref:F-box domain-containing protein n=1 Tax=Phascolomyces articulosus TaxID=60185 RepID=A0AAD5KC81_9FUNG|nr:hypothetical protein BDA99DRAFT_42778 [Phascolomyces articulosus]